MELTYSQIKEIVYLVGDEWRSIASQLADGESDVSTRSHNYRFIAADDIDEIMQNELGDDLYVLGCFNASFLASVTRLPFKAIKAIQDAEAYEALGELLSSMNFVEAIAHAYAAADGYGHHFAHYDSATIEIGPDLYAFRTN